MYIAYFDEIIMDLPNASEEELVHAYIYGLKPYIKGNVKAHIRHDSNTLSHGKTAVGKKQHFPPTKSPTFPTLWDTSKKIEVKQQQK